MSQQDLIKQWNYAANRWIKSDYQRAKFHWWKQMKRYTKQISALKGEGNEY